MLVDFKLPNKTHFGFRGFDTVVTGVLSTVRKHSRKLITKAATVILWTVDLASIESGKTRCWSLTKLVHVNKLYKAQPRKNGRLETRDQQDTQVTDIPASYEARLS